MGNICTWSSTYSPRSSIPSPCSSVLVEYLVEAVSARISGPWELGSGNVFLTGSTNQHMVNPKPAKLRFSPRLLFQVPTGADSDKRNRSAACNL